MPPLSSVVRFGLLAASVLLLGACSAESRKAKALERAAEAYRAGDFEKARIEYQNVLQKFPDDPLANERLALIWYDRGATVRALAFFSRLNLEIPSNQPLRVKRARVILSLGRISEARRDAETALRLSSNVPEALVLLTDTIRERGDFKAAEEVLQKYPDKNSAWYQIASANVAMLRGDAAAARTALQRALVLDPKLPDAHAAMARFHASQNDPTQALAEHKAAVELAPLRSPLRLAYVSFLLQTGARTEALAALQDLTKRVPDYFPPWRALSQIALQERRFDDALALLQNVLRQDNIDVDAIVLRSRVHLARGDAATAIAELGQLGAALPGLALEKYPLALAHLQNHDQASAIAALEQAVVAQPDNLDAILLLAQLNLRNGKPQATADAVTALVNRRPDLMAAYTLLIEAASALGRLDPLAQALSQNATANPKDGQVRYILGLVHLKRAKPDEAQESFEAALKVNPGLIAADVEVVNLDLRAGRTDAALTRAQAIAARFPKLAAGQILIGRVHAARKDWTAAQASGYAAVELAPNDPGAYGVLAGALTPVSDQADAITRLEEFLSRRGDNALAILLGGQIYMARKEFEKARALYEKHLGVVPGSSVVMNNLANLLADQLNELDRALDLARRARELDPTSPAIADTYGWLLFKKNDARGALPHLQYAAKSLPESAEIQYHLGIACLAVGDDVNALAALRAAATLPGTFAAKDDAKSKLAELEKKVPSLSAPKK